MSRRSRTAHLAGHASGQRGAVPVEFALGAGLLLLPVAALVTVFPTWAERQSMATLAAQEAARTAAVADTWEAGTTAGSALAQQIAVNHGLPAGDVAVTWTGSLARGASVSASVTVPIPALTVPGIGGTGGFAWTATHTESVDSYRSFGAP